MGSADFVAKLRESAPMRRRGIHRWAEGSGVASLGEALASVPDGEWWLRLAKVFGADLAPAKLTLFAAECAERAMPAWAAKHPRDMRPQTALTEVRRWLYGKSNTAVMDDYIRVIREADLSVSSAQVAAGANVSDPDLRALTAACAAARSVHQPFDGALGAAILSADAAADEKAEFRWQADRLRELFPEVLVAR